MDRGKGVPSDADTPGVSRRCGGEGLARIAVFTVVQALFAGFRHKALPVEAAHHIPFKGAAENPFSIILVPIQRQGIKVGAFPILRQNDRL